MLGSGCCRALSLLTASLGGAWGLSVVSSYSSGRGAESTLLELSFDQSDLPSTGTTGVLEFQVEGAALGSGVQGLLHGTLEVESPKSWLERSLLGYVPEGFHTNSISFCQALQNEVQVEGARERNDAWRDYALQSRQQNTAARRRRRGLQQAAGCPNGGSVCRCSTTELAPSCELLSPNEPGRYACYQSGPPGQAPLVSFCVDSRQCLRGVADQQCMQQAAECQAQRSVSMYGGEPRCNPACNSSSYCRLYTAATAPQAGLQFTSACELVPSTVGGSRVGDTPGSGLCFDEAVTTAIMQQATEAFSRGFGKGYRGLSELYQQLEEGQRNRMVALEALENATDRQQDTLTKLLNNVVDLKSQERQLQKMARQDFPALQASLLEFELRVNESVREFEQQTGQVQQKLDTTLRGVGEDSAALNALFRAIASQSSLQSALLGEYTVDLEGLVDMARTTLGEIRELQVSEKSRRALAQGLYKYADFALQRYGTKLFAEGGKRPLGYARVGTAEDPYWFRFTSVLQFVQDSPAKSVIKFPSLEWALQDPELRRLRDSYLPNAGELAQLPAGRAPDDPPWTVEEYWSKQKAFDEDSGGVFTQYADTLIREYSAGSRRVLRWLLLVHVRFFCDPQYLLEQSDNWFTFRDVMRLLGPPGCEPPNLAGGTGVRSPNSCNCWVVLSRQRCLRSPEMGRWAPERPNASAFLSLNEDTCSENGDVTDKFYGVWFPQHRRQALLTSYVELNQHLTTWCGIATKPDAEAAGEEITYINTNLLQLARMAELGAPVGPNQWLGPWLPTYRLEQTEARYCSSHWADLEAQTALLQSRTGRANASTFNFLFYYSSQQAARFLRLRELTEVLLDVWGDLPDDVSIRPRPFFISSPAQMRAPQLPPALGDPGWTPPPLVSNCDTMTASFYTPTLLPLWQLRHVDTRQRFVLTLRDESTGQVYRQELEPVRRHQLPSDSMLVLGYLSCLHFACAGGNESYVYDVLAEEVSGHPNPALRSTDYAMFFPPAAPGSGDDMPFFAPGSGDDMPFFFNQSRHHLYPLQCTNPPPPTEQCGRPPTSGDPCAPYRWGNRATLAGLGDPRTATVPAAYWKLQHGSARFEPHRAGHSPVDSRKRLLPGTPWQKRLCEPASTGHPEGPLCQLLRTHWWPDVDVLGKNETLDNTGCLDGRFALQQLRWSERLVFRVPGTSFARRATLRSWCPLSNGSRIVPRSAYEPGLLLRLRVGPEPLGLGDAAAPRRPLRLELLDAQGSLLEQSNLELPPPGMYEIALDGTQAPPERVASLLNGTSGLVLRVSVGEEPGGQPSLFCWTMPLDGTAQEPAPSFFTTAGAGPGRLGPEVLLATFDTMQQGSVLAASSAAFASIERTRLTARLFQEIASVGKEQADRQEQIARLLNSWQSRQADLRDTILQGFASNQNYLRSSAQSSSELRSKIELAVNVTLQALLGSGLNSSLGGLEQDLNASLARSKTNKASMSETKKKWEEFGDKISAIGSSLKNPVLFTQVLQGYTPSGHTLLIPGQPPLKTYPAPPAVRLPKIQKFINLVVRAGRDLWREFLDVVACADGSDPVCHQCALRRKKVWWGLCRGWAGLPRPCRESESQWVWKSTLAMTAKACKRKQSSEEALYTFWWAIIIPGPVVIVLGLVACCCPCVFRICCCCRCCSSRGGCQLRCCSCEDYTMLPQTDNSRTEFTTKVRTKTRTKSVQIKKHTP